MAILRIQTSTAREGKTEDFNALVGEGAALMNSKGINTVVRVSHSGTDTIEVYTINFFENWTEYGKGMNMMMTDTDMQAYYFKSITSWAAVPIDNSEFFDIPSASTDHGEFPVVDSINNPSPNPNIIKPKIKKNDVENFGLKLKLLSELQYTLGIFLIDKNILYC